MEKKNRKSTFRTLAEALTFEKLKDMSLSMEHLNSRKMTVNEIKNVIREAFEDAKDTHKVKAKEVEGGWGDTELEKEMNWVKTLKLKEFFGDSAEAEKDDDDKDKESEEEE